MKNLYLIFIFFFFLDKAQNLVPNGSFETYSTCPSGPSVVSYALGWYSSSYTPDYFNACASSSTGFSIPSNVLGYQAPSDGQAYCGFYVYDVASNGREVISAQLLNPLSINQKYFVSFRVNLADNLGASGYGINKLGTLFSTQEYTISSPPPINNYSQVYTNTIIADSLNWTLINGYFVADSIYNYINVSNFFNSASTDTTLHNPNSSNSVTSSYYFVDDIRVSTDSLFGLGYVGINYLIDLKEEIVIFPNPASEYFYLMGLDEKLNYSILDLTGRLIREGELDKEEKIYIKDLSPSVYILQLKNSRNQRKIKRFIVGR